MTLGKLLLSIPVLIWFISTVIFIFKHRTHPWSETVTYRTNDFWRVSSQAGTIIFSLFILFIYIKTVVCNW